MIDRMRQMFGSDNNMDDISRNVQQIAEGVERIKSTGAIFDANGMQEYDRALLRVQRNLRLMHEDYRRLTEQAIRFQEVQDDLTKGGYGRPSSGSGGSGSRGAARGFGSSSAGRPNMAQRYVQMNQQQVEGWKTKALSMATAGGVLGFTISRVMRGLQVRINEEAARLGMEGGLGLSGAAGNAAFKGMARRGIGFGLSPAQAMPFMLQTGRATGYSHKGSAISNMALSRGLNLQMGDLTGMQRAARMGGDRSLGGILNEAMINSLKNTGIKRELWEEFLKSSTQVLQGMSPGNTAIDAKQQMGLLALMSQRMGGVYARSPQRTGSLMSRMGQGMAINGGDDAVSAFKLRAFGFGRGKSYVEAMMQSEMGATPENVRSILKQADLENPEGMGRQGKSILLKKALGLTMRESYDLAGMRYDDLGVLSRQMAESGGLNIDKLQKKVGRRTVDTRREIGRQQAMRNLAGSKGVQSALDKIAKIETSFIDMLAKVSNFVDLLSQKKLTKSEKQAETRRRTQRLREEKVFDADKPRGRNKTELGRFYGLVPDGA